MKEELAGEFEITPTQYQSFRFRVAGRTTVKILLIATAPVTLLLQRTYKAEHEEKMNSFSDARSWPSRKSVDEDLELDPGTWYLAVEAVDEPSRGLIKVLRTRPLSSAYRLVSAY